MIISRMIARRRIAAGVRPGWFAAWGPVMADAALLALCLVLIWPIFRSVSADLNFPVWASVLSLFLVGFIPIQGVLIMSSLWATKSRWSDEGNGNQDEPHDVT
ncbi:MAG: hypothetical protein LC676_02815 [Loktanella sp.]|nr:hypothetical protein [Loktanella sp.]